MSGAQSGTQAERTVSEILEAADKRFRDAVNDRVIRLERVSESLARAYNLRAQWLSFQVRSAHEGPVAELAAALVEGARQRTQVIHEDLDWWFFNTATAELLFIRWDQEEALAGGSPVDFGTSLERELFDREYNHMLAAVIGVFQEQNPGVVGRAPLNRMEDKRS